MEVLRRYPPNRSNGDLFTDRAHPRGHGRVYRDADESSQGRHGLRIISFGDREEFFSGRVHEGAGAVNAAVVRPASNRSRNNFLVVSKIPINKGSSCRSTGMLARNGST